jgi:parallel beta-helix repeat protein
MDMRRTVSIGIFFSFILIGTIFLSMQVPVAKAANFVGQTIYLRADGSIEPSDAPVDVHGTTYTLTGDIQCPSFGYCINIERSGILLDGDGYTIEGWNPENAPIASGLAIYAGFVSNIEIRNIIIKGCAGGITVQSVSGEVKIHNTTINAQTQTEGSETIGISITSCDSANIDQNQILNNYNAIQAQSSNCSITNNRIMHNTGAGVYLAGSDSRVLSNLIAKNDLGIEIEGSNNLIRDNDILSNNRIGIFIGAPNNLFTGNNIVGQNSTNAYGIQMIPYQGENTFYHNDFENNYIQVEGGDLALIANIWDNGYPSGGNYWDTYHGVDSYSGVFQNETGSDDIGDNLYQITTANIDNYPLMQPVRPNPDISEETTTQEDYALTIAIILVTIVFAIIALIIIYRIRRKKKMPEENSPAQQKTMVGKLSVPVSLTLSIMIILNFTSIAAGTYQLGSVELYGGALYFDEILIGFLSSIAGLFLTWKFIVRQEYTASKLREISSAVLISFLFVAYLLSYTVYNRFELFGLLQYIQPTLVMVWTFVTTLVGCCLGFWLGGSALKRTQVHSNAAAKTERSIAYLRLASVLILVFAGLFTGYAAGYIVWAAFGRIQTVMGVSFSYWAVFPPTLPFLLVWAVVGALLFSLGTLVSKTQTTSTAQK